MYWAPELSATRTLRSDKAAMRTLLSQAFSAGKYGQRLGSP